MMMLKRDHEYATTLRGHSSGTLGIDWLRRERNALKLKRDRGRADVSRTLRSLLRAWLMQAKTGPIASVDATTSIHIWSSKEIYIPGQWMKRWSKWQEK